MFALLCGASRDFMKALKAFRKPFEAPQRSVKIKISFNFSRPRRLGREELTGGKLFQKLRKLVFSSF